MKGIHAVMRSPNLLGASSAHALAMSDVDLSKPECRMAKDSKSRKLRLLLFADYFPPGHRGGGSLRAVWHIVEHFAMEWDITVLTRNHDLGDPEPFTEQQLRMIGTCGADVVYLPSGIQGTIQLARILRGSTWDVAYLNSFFSPTFSILPSLLLKAKRGVPTLMAPRGELFESALQYRKWKKLAFISIARISRLYAQTHWHATSVEERDTFTKLRMVRPDFTHISPDLPPKNPPVCSNRIVKVPGEIELLFVGRIHPHKGLYRLLNYLNAVRGRVRLRIVGPTVDQEYFQACRELAKDLPPSVEVEWVGHLTHERTLDEYARAHLHVLPTESENHGFTIHEALQQGRPVLTSLATPWSDQLSRGGGVAQALEDEDAWVSALNHFIALDQEAFDRCCELASQAGREGPSAEDPVESTRSLIYRVAGLRP